MRCTFCNSNIEKGTGLMFVRTSGRILNFCSSKCKNNMLVLKRKARKLKWASTEKKEKK